MIVLFLFILTVFNAIYSLLIGTILASAAMPIMLIYGEDQDPPFWYTLLTVLFLFSVCIGQGLVVAGAVSYAVYHDTHRWAWLWYAACFSWSAPIALTKNMGNSKQKWEGYGILASGIAYVVACINPIIIPKLLLKLSGVLAI